YYGAINVGEATLKHFMLSISRFLRNPEIKEMLGKKITVSIINLLLKLPFIIDEEISAELNALKATLQIETEEINPPTLNEAIDLMSLETGEEEAVLPRIDPHVEAEKEGMLEELDAPVVPIPTNAGAQAFAGGHYNSTNSVVLLPKSKENNVSGQSNARNTPARQVQHLFKKSNSANWEFRKFTNLEEDPSPRFREPKPYPLNPHPSREKILPEQENIPPDTLRRSDSLRMEPSEFKLPISRTAGARELSALRSEELVPRRRHDDVSVGDMPVDGATYQNRTRSTSVDGDSGGPKYINSPSKLRKSSGNLA
ncbi:MAG: hypothetical protein ACXWM7_05435, partial [Parachlamydiaceae bacterium]